MLFTALSPSTMLKDRHLSQTNATTTRIPYSAKFSVLLFGFVSMMASAQQNPVCHQTYPQALPASVDEELAGCTCSFSPRKEPDKTIFAWPLGNNAEALINVCGSVQKLSLIKTSTVSGGNRNHVGDLHLWKFKRANLSATVWAKQSSPDCGSGSECEGFSLAGILTFSVPGKKVRVPTEGACGC